MEMNCNKCRAVIPEESSFCLKCGEKIDKSEETWEVLKESMNEVGVFIFIYREFMDKHPEIEKKFNSYRGKNEKRITEKYKANLLKIHNKNS